MAIRTVRDVTRDLLRELGMTTVFGNPGTTEVAFLTEWPEDFRYVLGLQESVVVGMADGYAQAARRPVLVNLHSAGGVGHGLGHVFGAYRNHTPMIVLAGQQNRSLLPDEPFLGALDATSFPKPYVKWSCEPARAQDVPAAIARAYHVATQAPQGPVFLSVPVDDWDAEAEGPVPVRPPLPGFAPDPAAIAELAAALNASAAPALVLGPAVDAENVVAEAVTLAERTGAGVWVSPLSSRCSFPEDHPQFLGFLQPEREAAAIELAGHDLVVVLGSPVFTYHVYRGEAVTPLPPLFLISEDEQVLARARAGTGIRATAKLALEALLRLATVSDRPRPAVRARVPAPAETEPLSPDFVCAALAEALPPDAIVVEEIPSHRRPMHDQLPITSTDAGFFTAAGGVLGYALPAAIGAAIARPERRVVALLGDGSSMYSIQALWTAAREQVPVTVVVLDNAQYAAVRILGETAGGSKMPGVKLGGIDFAALAESLGCVAHSVRGQGELRPALAAALSADRPSLVHVTVDPDPQQIY